MRFDKENTENSNIKTFVEVKIKFSWQIMCMHLDVRLNITLFQTFCYLIFATRLCYFDIKT